MVTMAVFMFPTMLKMNLARSDAYRASWIFFATPIDRARAIRSSKNILVVTFLLPYLVIVGVVLAFFSTNTWHLVVHLVVVALMSHLVLQAATFLEPEMPFSKPMVKSGSSPGLRADCRRVRISRAVPLPGAADVSQYGERQSEELRRWCWSA